MTTRSNQYAIYQHIPHVCYACGLTNTTVNSRGTPNWILNLDANDNLIGMLCAFCYSKYLRLDAHRQRDRLLYRFGSHRQRVGYRRELTGRCSQCSNNIYDDSCKATHMHHRIYIIIFPWFGRNELCASCHAKETWQGWKWMRGRIRR